MRTGSILLGYAEARGGFRDASSAGRGWDDSGEADLVPAGWQVSAMDVRNGAVAWSREETTVESTVE